MTTDNNIRHVTFLNPKTGVIDITSVAVPVKSEGWGSLEGEKECASNPDMDGDLFSDLATPLTAVSRRKVVKALETILTSSGATEDEVSAVSTLALSWHCDDDRVLKLLGRLLKETRHDMSKFDQLQHEKAMLEATQTRLREENKALTDDLVKVVDERDAALRSAEHARNTDLDDSVRLNSCIDTLKAENRSLTQNLNHVTVACERAAAERDMLKRDAQRNIENALYGYESTVMARLADVARQHKVAVEENKGLRDTVATLRNQLVSVSTMTITQASKANVMIENVVKEENMVETCAKTTTDIQEHETLRCGDEVYLKVSGEGPFVLVTQVEEGRVKYANPIPGVKNHFNAGEVPVSNPWLVRDAKGSMQCHPAPVLTKRAPKRAVSFGGVKSVITSDVTAKLFQAAIWVTMLGLLAKQHLG